ncbi:MAG: hypothetical protein IPM02_13020 [Betaproteobacteria bacterium]|nr:hypothetical protein [Betaproteobacteria bacterium]
MSLLEPVFWLSVGAVLYSNFGYPLVLLAIAAPRRPAPRPEPTPDASLPSVAVLVAAYNEERHIAERVRNLLTLDYPCRSIAHICRVGRFHRPQHRAPARHGE